jgi:hypothetical protein
MDIKLNEQLQNCNDEDVLDLGNSFLCKLGRFRQALISIISYHFPRQINEELKKEGIEVKNIFKTRDQYGSIRTKSGNADWTHDVECKILKINSKGWQTGRFRIKISVEFETDEPEIEETTEIKEPESPLDDLRRMINDATS